MKKRSIKLLFLVAFLFTVSFSASAQIYVKIRPHFPVLVRPPQPTHAHIWIGEDWESNGGSYKYSGGYWEAPPQRGYYRTAGHWQHTPRGHVWIKGNWKKSHKRH
jgi:hypothetical protein